jgi:hypothetical protein
MAVSAIAIAMGLVSISSVGSMVQGKDDGEVDKKYCYYGNTMIAICNRLRVEEEMEDQVG